MNSKTNFVRKNTLLSKELVYLVPLFLFTTNGDSTLYSGKILNAK